MEIDKDKVRFPLEREEEIEHNPENFKLLERVPLTRADVIERLPITFLEMQPNERIASVVIVDTATTGISAMNDKIIELSLVKCTMSVDRRCILSIDRIYNEFEDPQRPIPPNISKLTGITDKMVRGHSFNQDLVLSFFADSPLVIAHNARFDRAFFDRRFSSLNNQAWSCTQYEIDWHSLGFGSNNLEFIVQSVGFFYDSHRAINNSLALCYLLHILQPAFEQLFLSSLQQVYRVDAYKAPFAIKDKLKENGFHWDANDKVWYIQVKTAKEVLEQVNFLSTLYYNAEYSAKINVFTAKDRYRG